MKALIKNLGICLLVILCSSQLVAQNKPKAVTVVTKTPDAAPAAHVNGEYINRIQTFLVAQPGLSDAQIIAASTGTAQLSTQYMDALGRPLQRVIKQSSPLQKDMVEAFAYDGFGRDSYKYMPYTSTQATGEFIKSPFTQQSTVLNARHLEDDIFYSKTEYDNSPLNRPNKVMAAGNNWVGENRGIDTEWSSNTIDDHVRVWVLGSPGCTNCLGEVMGQIPVIATPEINPFEYPAGRLTVVTTTDENLHQVKEFTNKSGQLVLKRVQKGSTTNPGHDDWLSIYYVYDNEGNLAYVLPPKAVDALAVPAIAWDFNNAAIDELVLAYGYDERRRLITRKVPGSAPTHMVYDKMDRMVLSQDGNQLEDDQWTFFKYDNMGRLIFEGFITYTDNDANTDDWDVLQGLASAWTGSMFVEENELSALGVAEGEFITVSHRDTDVRTYRSLTTGSVEFSPGFETESGDDFDTELSLSLSEDYSHIEGYYDATFPKLVDYDFELIRINYFDEYNFTSKDFSNDYQGFYTTGTNTNNAVPLPATPYQNVTGLQTGSKIRVLGDNSGWLTSVSFFDDRARTIQVRSDNHLGGEDITTTQYDFTEHVLYTYLNHTNPQAISKNSTKILKEYEYDHSERLISIKQKLDDTGSFKTILSNTFNELGELESKTLGTLETLGYDYNVRGWLKSINGDYVDSGAGSHFFGINLSYDNGFDLEHFNGNISGVVWRTQTSEKQRAYGFEYDTSNRLIKADYTQKGGSETTWTRATQDYSSTYGYDSNGNLETLTRSGVIAGTKLPIDNLNYDFEANEKSNRLIRVQDLINEAEGFNNPNGSADDYEYDANGNISKDNNKDITEVEYNHMNLPTSVTFTTGRSILFTYNTEGSKVTKLANDNGLITKTDYVGSFIYESSELQQFSHEEGRVRKSATTGNLVYDYYIKDHLENTRMTITEEQEVITYKATLETEHKGFEEQVFMNLDNSRVVFSAADMTDDDGGAIIANEVSRLNGTDTDRTVGPGKILIVSPGDQVDLSVYAYYEGTIGGTNNAVSEGAITTAVASAFGGLNGGNSEQQAIYGLFNDPGYAVLVGAGAANTSIPRAYLNYMFFDQDFNFVETKSDAIQITGAAGNDNIPELITEALSINQGGYLYVYVSNESDVNFEVYFDELNVQHTKGTILQEDHYYPFGMNISALSSNAPQSTPNRFRFNGMELQGDFGLNWYDYGSRNYDPVLGRWNQVDPMAAKMPMISPYAYSFNNPVLYQDKDGRLPIIPLLLKAGAAGAADLMMQVAMNYFFDDKVNTLGEALDNVNWWQVSRSAAEGLIPWRTPGGRLGKAAATAVGDVLSNFLHEGSNYTQEQALQDFMVGFLGDLAGGGIEKLIKKFGGKKVAQVFERLGLSKNPCECFMAGTKVNTSEGYKAIEEVEEGDLVWAYNEETEDLALKEVTETFTIEQDHIYRIYFEDEIIEASGSHPFFIGGNWVNVEDLEVCDKLTLYDGREVAIDKIEYEEGNFKVFNFTVADYHNYYVSEENVLVHNCAVNRSVGKKGKAPSNIRDMMKSQKIAPDLADKGVHFNIGKIELKAVPDHKGGVTFKAVHPGMAAKKKVAYQSAVKEAMEALQSPEFRNWLKKHAEKGFEMTAPSGNAKAKEFMMLIKALGEM